MSERASTAPTVNEAKATRNVGKKFINFVIRSFQMTVIFLVMDDILMLVGVSSFLRFGSTSFLLSSGSSLLFFEDK